MRTGTLIVVGICAQAEPAQVQQFAAALFGWKRRRKEGRKVRRGVLDAGGLVRPGDCRNERPNSTERPFAPTDHDL